MLQCVKNLAERHKNIMVGDDPAWDGLLSANYSLVENITDYTHLELAELLTKDDITCFQRFQLNDFLCPTEGPSSRSLRDIGAKWTSLGTAVKICTTVYPTLVGRIGETTKVNLISVLNSPH